MGRDRRCRPGRICRKNSAFWAAPSPPPGDATALPAGGPGARYRPTPSRARRHPAGASRFGQPSRARGRHGGAEGGRRARPAPGDRGRLFGRQEPVRDRRAPRSGRTAGEVGLEVAFCKLVGTAQGGMGHGARGDEGEGEERSPGAVRGRVGRARSAPSAWRGEERSPGAVRHGCGINYPNVAHNPNFKREKLPLPGRRRRDCEAAQIQSIVIAHDFEAICLATAALRSKQGRKIPRF